MRYKLNNAFYSSWLLLNINILSNQKEKPSMRYFLYVLLLQRQIFWFNITHRVWFLILTGRIKPYKCLDSGGSGDWRHPFHISVNNTKMEFPFRCIFFLFYLSWNSFLNVFWNFNVFSLLTLKLLPFRYNLLRPLCMFLFVAEKMIFQGHNFQKKSSN